MMSSVLAVIDWLRRSFFFRKWSKLLELKSSPLERSFDGKVLFVLDTLIPFAAVAKATLEGGTPETIGREFPSLRTRDVYGVMAKCLECQEDVKKYLTTAVEPNGDERAEKEREALEPKGDVPGQKERKALEPKLLNKPSPLALKRQLRLRIKGTSVPLEDVVIAFKRGETVEQIKGIDEKLTVPTVYHVLAHVLAHEDDVNQYLRQRGVPEPEINPGPWVEYPAANAQEAALLKAYEYAWQDHFQTRVQTWKPLEIEAVMALTMVGTDLKFGDKHPILTFILAILLALVAGFGFKVTRHHRGVELKCFRTIAAIEKHFRVRDPLHTPPKDIRWPQIVNPFISSTPLFILRVHSIIFAFACGYAFLRCTGRLGP